MKVKKEVSVGSHKEAEGLYYHQILTGDDSFSLCTTSNEETEAETMHSSFGAFTETEYIYGDAVREIFEHDLDHYQFVNLGLGIGYNELSILCNALKLKIPTDKIKIDSYESVSSLNINFSNFYIGTKSHAFMDPIYQNILQRYSLHFDLDPTDIKELIRKQIESQDLCFKASMNLEAANNLRPFNVLLFDAYSKNTSPDLWTPELLDTCFSKALSPSLVSTYAATGDLKRSLKAAGFNCTKRDGFAMKRESTFAVKS